jgi:hypothetical protein
MDKYRIFINGRAYAFPDQDRQPLPRDYFDVKEAIQKAIALKKYGKVRIQRVIVTQSGRQFIDNTKTLIL